MAMQDAKPDFPLRLFTKDDEPFPDRSICIFSGSRKLLDTLRTVLGEDEWEEILNSRLGVFLHFHEQNISWASRLVHFMLSFQLVCNKNHEIWSLIGVTPVRFSLLEFEHITELNCEYVENLMCPEVEVTDELKEFWEKLGVSVEAGPSYEELWAACSRSNDDEWTREDRLRLGYLALLASCIDAHSHTTPINVNLARMVMDLERFVDYPWGRVAFKTLISSVKTADITRTYHIDGFLHALQSLVFFALPEFAEQFGKLNPRKQSPPLLVYIGAKGKRNFKTKMLKQTNINSFVRKDFKDMFPVWDDDGDDDRITNILTTMYGQGLKKAWKWKSSHWPSLGVLPSNNNEKLQKKGVKKAVEYVAEESYKKVRVESASDAFENRLIDAVKVAIDERLIKFEGLLKEQLVNVGVKINNLVIKVAEVATSVVEISKRVPNQETAEPVEKVADEKVAKEKVAGKTVAEEKVAKEKVAKQGGPDVKPSANMEGVSLPPLKLKIIRNTRKKIANKDNAENEGDNKVDDKDVNKQERKSNRLKAKNNIIV